MKIRFIALFTMLFSVSSGWAQSNNCETTHEVDKFTLLRRLSLDLRNRGPSFSEYEELKNTTKTPYQIAEPWYDSEEFRLAMRGYHEALFWPNVEGVRITSVSNGIVAPNNSTYPGPAFSANNLTRRRTYRIAPDPNTTILNSGQCLDAIQTQFEPGGGFHPVVPTTNLPDGGKERRDGYREVHPYWEPDASTTIRVCAYEAQESLRGYRLASGALVDGGYDCSSTDAPKVIDCGCGPNLRFCGYATPFTKPVHTSVREQLNLMVDRVTTGNRRYSELLLGARPPVNGTIAFWKSYVAPGVANVIFAGVPDEGEVAMYGANPNFVDGTFREVDAGRGDGGPDLYAGVLTSPAYLMRFNTGRARANRFRQDFACRNYEPKPLETPSATNTCLTTGTNLMSRCTCRGCHLSLEPLAAHWGQFTEGGTTLLNKQFFPEFVSTCKEPADGGTRVSGPLGCTQYYVTDRDDFRAGSRIAYQFSVLPDGGRFPAIADALRDGPRRAANSVIASGEFATCTVRRMYAHLTKTDLIPMDALDSGVNLDPEVSNFKTNESFKQLIKNLVNRPDYRRAR